MGKANSQTNPKSTNNKFWQFRNLADDDQKAELLLYGDISERSWWEDAATPKRFADDLAALGDVKEITVWRLKPIPMQRTGAESSLQILR